MLDGLPLLGGLLGGSGLKKREADIEERQSVLSHFIGQRIPEWIGKSGLRIRQQNTPHQNCELKYADRELRRLGGVTNVLNGAPVVGGLLGGLPIGNPIGLLTGGLGVKRAAEKMAKRALDVLR